jgi:hypothetical protein
MREGTRSGTKSKARRGASFAGRPGSDAAPSRTAVFTAAIEPGAGCNIQVAMLTGRGA